MSLFTKEWQWAIRSSCSLQKSKHEQFTHVALYKRTTCAIRSHRSLTKWVICLWFAYDLSGLLAKNKRFAQKIHIFHMFLTVFPPFYAQERIAPIALCSFALFKRATWSICSRHSVQKNNREWFAQVLMTKEQWERFTLFHEQVALSLTENEWIAQNKFFYSVLTTLGC